MKIKKFRVGQTESEINGWLATVTPIDIRVNKSYIIVVYKERVKPHKKKIEFEIIDGGSK